MKKFLLLTLSLLMALTLLVACNENDDPSADTGTQAVTDTAVTEPTNETVAETLPETTPETLPETESATTPSDDPDLDDLLEEILQSNQFETAGDYRIDSEIKLDIAVGMNGMETNMSLTGGLSLIQQENQGISLEMTVPTQDPVSLVYIDGFLYVTNAEGKYRCPMDEVEMALVWSELMEDLFPTEDIPEDEEAETDDLMGGFADMLSTMKLSALFAETEVVTDEATGDITVTLTGLSQQAQLLINMMVSSMDGAGSDEISDMDMSLILDMLATFDMDALSLSMTVDKDHLLKACTVVMALDMTNAPDLTGDVPMVMTVTAATTLDRSEQTVTAPADGDTYEETDWRTLFGLYTAEMLGLVPDETGTVTLSEDPDTFALQYDYMMEHGEDFEGVTLSVTARGSDFVKNDDGTVQGTIYQVYEDGTPAYYPYLYVIIPADVAEGMTLPADESIIRLTAVLVIPDGETYTYYDYVVISYELVSDPVAVG